MENASKALIIAGSILLAILIIAMGVMIFNNAKNAADTSTFDTAEINMFNQKFERYSNTQLGSQVKSLISFAISNASTNKDEPSKLPTVIFVPENKQPDAQDNPKANGAMHAIDSGTTTNNGNEIYIKNLGDIRSTIKSTHNYKVTLDYASTGLIGTITIDYNP